LKISLNFEAAALEAPLEAPPVKLASINPYIVNYALIL